MSMEISGSFGRYMANDARWVQSEQRQRKEAQCITNTDKADREIEKLKEKKQQLERQIQSASGNEKEIRELEKAIAQIERELRWKDHDTYRRQNAEIS